MSIINKKTLLFLLLCLSAKFLLSQDKYFDSNIEVNYCMGRIIPIHKELKRELRGGARSSRSIMISYNKYTFGDKEWQRLYNYPTYGVTFAYQNNVKPFLGDVYSLMFHYTYYLYKRKLSVKVADGLSFATKPYNKQSNKRNLFLTSTLLNGFQLSTQYKEENFCNRFGWQIGAMFTHHSNGAVKLKNKGLNTFYLYAGVNYSLGKKDKTFIKQDDVSEMLDKGLHYNLLYRNGINENLSESHYKSFHNFSFFVDKHLNKKHVVQGGLDFFYSNFLKEWLLKNYPEESRDFKRVGLFLGHEYVIGDFSIPVQLGVYIYNPSKYVSDFYQRIGVTYSLNNTLYFTFGLKTHFERAEAIEYGGGIRF